MRIKYANEPSKHQSQKKKIMSVYSFLHHPLLIKQLLRSKSVFRTLIWYISVAFCVIRPISYITLHPRVDFTRDLDLHLTHLRWTLSVVGNFLAVTYSSQQLFLASCSSRHYLSFPSFALPCRTDGFLDVRPVSPFVRILGT